MDEIEIRKMEYLAQVAVDADGTPLSHGERMIEVEPGVWKDPAVVAAEDFLRAHLPDHHPEGCIFCPAGLLGLPRDRNGDPLCQTCPHLRKPAACTQERQNDG